MTIKAFNLSLSLETRKRMGNSVQVSHTTQSERIHSEDNSIGRAKLYSLCNGWIAVQKGIYELSTRNIELVFLEAKVENEITGEVIAHILSKVTPKGASEPLAAQSTRPNLIQEIIAKGVLSHSPLRTATTFRPTVLLAARMASPLSGSRNPPNLLS